MFELKVRVKSHWLLFYNGKEVRSGDKIFIRKWLKKFYPEVDYENLKVTKVPSSFSSQTLIHGGWFCDLEGNRLKK